MARHKIDASLRIKASIKQVSSILENIALTPKWNPLINAVNFGRGPRKGLGSNLKWRANLAGIAIGGSSKAISWKPGKEYAWRNIEEHTGLSLEGRFLLKPANDHTDLKAIVSYDLPDAVVPILDSSAVKSLLKRAVQESLYNIDRLVSKR